MPSIARRNLFEDLPRFLVAQAGIMFAVSLVTIQTGILAGFTRSTSRLIDQSSADLWLASDEVIHLERTLPLTFETLQQVEAIAGVAKAEPLMRGSARWQVEGGDLTIVRVFGFDPAGELFQPGNLVAGEQAALKAPHTILVDESKLRSLNVSGVGDRIRLANQPTQIVGITSNTQSLASSIYIFASLANTNLYANAGVSSSLNCTLDEGSVDCTANSQTELINPDPQAVEPLNLASPLAFVLIKAEANVDLDNLAARLNEQIPGTVTFTTAAFSAEVRRYWQNSTGVGFILGLGATVGVVVGMVIVGQILYASVSDHIKEFGTLKAMGASDRFLYSIILEQSVWMAILGYIPGMLICWGVAHWALTTQGILILITPWTAIGVFGVAVGMCMGSAVFAIQKVMRVDPAIVFKA
ncbi:MAG: FtsX-like permease family protein [Cyanobacteria bacterium P01_G01_bin.54]